MASKASKGKKKKESNYQNEVFRPQKIPFMYYGEKMPVSKAGPLSLALHFWLTPIMCRLSPSRIMGVLGLQWHEEDTTEFNVNRLEESWEAEKAAKGPEKASLFKAILHSVKHRIIISLIVVLCTLSFSFLGSAGILRLLLEHVSEADSDTVKGACIVTGLIACEVCRSLTFSLAWALNYWNGSRVRGAAMGLLYKKVLKLKCLREKKIGEIVNLCSYDGQRFFEVMANGPFIIGGPVIFVAGSIYLFFLLGPWAGIGCVTYIFSIVLLNLFAKGMAYFRTQATQLTGERVSLMTEVLSCIKLIKINVWERAFTKRITAKRREEQVALERALFLQSMTASLSPMIPIFASIFMFLSYILTGNRLTAAKAFTLISVLYSMSFALTLMIYGIRTLLDAKISAQRYQEVLMLGEIEPKPPPEDKSYAIVFNGGNFSWDEEMDEDEEEEEEDELLRSLTATELAERRARKPLHNGGLAEERRKSTKSQATWHLANINLHLKKGQLIGICGMKGSGKSSLLSAVLGRMLTMDGSVEVGGKVAYSSQEPWIFNGNARDNILFGQKYDEARYQTVIKACGLAKDFDTFSLGDMVEVGDRGLTLSGGQKQRISIARAAYSQSDIYLLDDPLSAQDVQIGRHIFSECFQELLHGKTVVFVTHHLEYLSRCDYVVLMQHGRCVEQGTHEELMEAGQEYADLQDLYQSKYREIQRERLKSYSETQGGRVPQRGFSRHSKKLLTKQLSRLSTREYQHQFSAMSNSSGAFPSDYDYVDIDDMVDAMELSECKVPAKVVHTYLMAAGGYCVIILALLAFIVSMAVQASANWWLSYWLSQEAQVFNTQNQAAGANTSTSPLFDSVSPEVSGNGSGSANYSLGGGDPVVLASNGSEGWTGRWDNWTERWDNWTGIHGNGTEGSPGPDLQTHTNALVYGLIAIAMIVTMAFREVLFIKIILRAASRLHKGMLEKLLRCPMKFFDVTPLGIILNRFATDLDELDVRFPTNCGLFLQNVMMVTLALVVICYMFPWVLLAVLPLALVFAVLAYKYAPILQRLKYLDSVMRSPFLSHLAASVEGLATIHVFQQSGCFVSQ